jgi:DHA3 family tetracycline resistance protein-like MFS transporter
MGKLPAERIYMLLAIGAGVVGKVTFAMSTIYRVEIVGLDVFQLVFLGTVLEASVFLFEIPTGVVADVYSRRLSVIIGIAMMGVGFMVEGLVPTYIVVLIAQVIWGVGWTFVSGAQSAWITDEVGVEKAGDLFLSGRQLLQVGSLVGIAVAVPLANISLQLPYFVGGGLYLLLAMILILFMDETGFKPIPKEEREGWQELFNIMRSGVRLVRSRTALLWYALIALFVGLYSEGWDRLTQPHLLENHSFPDLFSLELGPVEWFGIISIAGNLLVIGVSQLVRKRMDTTKPRVLARGLQFLYLSMVVSMVGFALAGQFWVAITFMLIFDALRSVTWPLSNAFVNHHVDSEVRATVLSMTGQVDALGQMSGGPLIGFIGRITSIPIAIITSAAILFPTVPLFGLLLKSDSKE